MKRNHIKLNNSKNQNSSNKKFTERTHHFPRLKNKMLIMGFMMLGLYGCGGGDGTENEADAIINFTERELTNSNDTTTVNNTETVSETTDSDTSFTMLTSDFMVSALMTSEDTSNTFTNDGAEITSKGKITEGGRVTLKVAQTEKGKHKNTSLAYQWTFNGQNIPGATDASITLTKLTADDSGEYRVAITKNGSTVLSNPFILTITVIEPEEDPVAITSLSGDQTVGEGGNLSLSVSASGTDPIAYQWLFEGSPISGATSSQLSLTNVTLLQAGNYSVQVSNNLNQVISNNITVSVIPLPTIDPVSITGITGNQAVTEGDNVTLSVSVTGTGPIAFQWLLEGQPISGATANQLTLSSITPSQGGNYSVRVSNEINEVTSANITVSVVALPTTFNLTLNWDAPTLREDDSPLPAEEIQEYKIYLGESENDLTLLKTVTSPSNQVIDDLLAGRYYVSVSAVDTNNIESQRTTPTLIEVGSI